MTNYTRDVAKAALDRNATAILLVHNHPSGNPAPSDADTLTSCDSMNCPGCGRGALVISETEVENRTMNPKTRADIAQAVHRHFAESGEAAWIKGAYATFLEEKTGRHECSPYESEASCFCLTGMIKAATRRERGTRNDPMVSKATGTLMEAQDDMYWQYAQIGLQMEPKDGEDAEDLLVAFNDLPERKFSDVLALCETVASRLREAAD